MGDLADEIVGAVRAAAEFPLRFEFDIDDMTYIKVCANVDKPSKKYYVLRSPGKLYIDKVEPYDITSEESNFNIAIKTSVLEKKHQKRELKRLAFNYIEGELVRLIKIGGKLPHTIPVQEDLRIYVAKYLSVLGWPCDFSVNGLHPKKKADVSGGH